jgi:pyocin large subunit-like protein
MRRIGAFIVVLLALAVILRQNRTPGASRAPVDRRAPAASQPTANPSTAGAPTVDAPAVDARPGSALAPRVRVSQPEVGFRSSDRLDEHYAKHGAEFRGLSKAQYLAAAQQLRDATPGGDILEIVRPSDGVVSRFDRGSGAFLAYDRDGTIRTFFKPNDGESYFRRQAKRQPTH